MGNTQMRKRGKGKRKANWVPKILAFRVWDLGVRLMIRGSEDTN